MVCPEVGNTMGGTYKTAAATRAPAVAPVVCATVRNSAQNLACISPCTPFRIAPRSHLHTGARLGGSCGPPFQEPKGCKIRADSGLRRLPHYGKSTRFLALEK